MAAGVMARMVGNAAIVTFPKSAECRFKHIELVSLQQYLAMMVLILGNAVLRRQTIKFDEDVK